MNARPGRRPAESIAWFAAFVASYWLAYRFGMSFGHQSPSPFWIPDSVLLAALLKSRPRHWWVFILATLPIRLSLGLQLGLPLWFLLTTFVVDSARGITAALILRHFLPNPIRFGSMRDFAVFAVGVAIVIS